MSKNFLMDTTILIDHLNGIEQATEFILENQKNLKLSVITRAEVLTGVSKKNAAQVKLLLDFFPLLTINAEIADLAADLRQKFKWKLPDAFQAALAIQHQLKLVTRNSKAFSSSKHSFVSIPYHLP